MISTRWINDASIMYYNVLCSKDSWYQIVCIVTSFYWADTIKQWQYSGYTQTQPYSGYTQTQQYSGYTQTQQYSGYTLTQQYSGYTLTQQYIPGNFYITYVFWYTVFLQCFYMIC